ncbi:MAG: glycosyltransferase family 2 protein [Saprospiraceae bacterium]|nr:glycosyltransferase family 2 protein [Saprospiraceae bacterium]MBK6782751.1 glycosyltransferase family 2 protein [Saprospiraceae bacterium]MBK7523198.1 glycosyltransferase family 2 protein [Saprospiraceae bacterium]MBK8079298.1 glycosyltransferase family 2 protein [Saprospiraceae bacterium]MBK8371807.1 glycosyltransferase family 2 protein [Saprospiraceae bacterium]
MKISGFTFIRNGINLDYPFIESILSILPIVDEMIVVVGDCEDGTRESIVRLPSPKIKIIDTVWDENMRKGGEILAQQTNIALDNISGDWGFYIQGDEVLHEKYYEVIVEKMKTNLHNEKVDGLLFNYLHFYGSYDFVGTSRKWYRNEIRIIRNNPKIRSYKDAQGFRKAGKKLHVKNINASIYHYGWVRDPHAQLKKAQTFNKLWHDDDWIRDHVSAEKFDYDLLENLEKFSETHPKVMQKRLSTKNWDFSYNPDKKRNSIKEKLSIWLEKITGYRIGEYKNYILLSD